MRHEETKKELGQHWLRDRAILQAIAEAAELKPDDFVLEIGPGLGTLTEVLAAKATVKALEYDQDLLERLQTKFKDTKHVEIVHGDVRRFNFSQLPENYKIVANIPYYLTSHLIRSVSETSSPPTVAVLLVQKEVAERICAEPGQMSILSVTAQFYFACSLGIPVPARYFMPPPKVDSQVVVIKRRPQKLFDVDEKAFFRLVKAGFSEKRKKLANALSGGLQISKQQAADLIEKAGLNPAARAQQLAMDDWQKLYGAYNESNEA